jgi:UDP:flavonoid glycosyltransferase YjiC (YdhE family)
MAHILVVFDGFPSLLSPNVELARRLAAEGHRLTFAGLSGARELVESHGLEFLPLHPSRYQEFLRADAGTGALERLVNLGRRRRRALESTRARGFARAVRDLDPDLVLINGEMHEHIIALSATEVPMAVLNTFVSIWRETGLPPPHHLVRPGIGWTGTRIAISLLWIELRLRKRLRAWWQAVGRIGCDRLSVLRLLARDAGFDLRRETDDTQWLIPFTYRRLPILSLHALEFEFPHRPPAGVVYLGPMVLESRTDRELPAEDRVSLDRILERRRTQGDRKLIYAGFGTVLSTDLGFLKRLFGIVAQRPHWDLVISLAGRISPGDLGPLPDRVYPFAWVPQMRVLNHADVVVNHGGIHTVDECVVRGVPMLVYNGLETDMAGTTARVVQHGLGLAGDRKRDSAAVIRGYLDRLLSEPRFRDDLGRLRRCYAAYAENRVAERAVEALLAGTRRPAV